MKQTTLRRSLVAILSAIAVGAATPSFAFNFGDMMNPTKWMGGGRNRDSGYNDGPWGGPGYGYGAPGYGPGFGGPGYGGYGGPGYGGYGGPGYGGYGGPGYGGPGYGGYGAPGGYPGGYGAGGPSDYAGPAAPPAAAPMPTYRASSAGSPDDQSELLRLRERVQSLEGSNVR
jgi:hypothetical protein